MAKDLTAALHALTVEAQGQTPRQSKVLRPATEATEIPARTGASGPVRTAGGDGRSFSLGGARTLESSDGLFSFHFPATLTFVDSGVTYTLGVIEKTP